MRDGGSPARQSTGYQWGEGMASVTSFNRDTQLSELEDHLNRFLQGLEGELGG